MYITSASCLCFHAFFAFAFLFILVLYFCLKFFSQAFKNEDPSAERPRDSFQKNPQLNLKLQKAGWISIYNINNNNSTAPGNTPYTSQPKVKNSNKDYANTLKYPKNLIRAKMKTN